MHACISRERDSTDAHKLLEMRSAVFLLLCCGAALASAMRPVATRAPSPAMIVRRREPDFTFKIADKRLPNGYKSRKTLYTPGQRFGFLPPRGPPSQGGGGRGDGDGDGESQSINVLAIMLAATVTALPLRRWGHLVPGLKESELLYILQTLRVSASLEPAVVGGARR